MMHLAPEAEWTVTQRNVPCDSIGQLLLFFLCYKALHLASACLVSKALPSSHLSPKAVSDLLSHGLRDQQT